MYYASSIYSFFIPPHAKGLFNTFSVVVYKSISSGSTPKLSAASFIMPFLVTASTSTVFAHCFTIIFFFLSHSQHIEKPS